MSHTMKQFLGHVMLWSSTVVSSLNSTQNATTTACLQLNNSLNNVTFVPSESQYRPLSQENWSETCWTTPTCIIQPVSNAEVQNAVQVLTKHNVKFAIRSGGHSPSPFAANIDDGVLIDLSKLNQAIYDAPASLVKVGAGMRWGEVHQVLDLHNVTVVGGRVLDVGVGGLVLGSGLSYLSDLYGLVCDNVVNFEIVLANASITNANAKSNQDLFRALKGGANNFGIVTSFTLSTYPISQVWGGIKTYSLEQLPALFASMYQYQSNPNKDPYANLMFQAFTTNETVGGVLNMVYLKPEVSPPAFAPFYSIPTTEDTTKLQTLTQMMGGQRVPPLTRWDWFATSFKPNPSLYRKIASIMVSAPELADIQAVQGGSLALGLQPISASVVHAGAARGGGNSLGLQAVNQTWFALDVGWLDARKDPQVRTATGAIRERIARAAKEEGEQVEYLFMNDANTEQDVIAHYGPESVGRLREVQRRYDPDSVFQKLVSGGWKLPGVNE